MNNLGNLLYVLLKPVPIAGMGHTRQERLIGNVFSYCSKSIIPSSL